MSVASLALAGAGVYWLAARPAQRSPEPLVIPSHNERPPLAAGDEPGRAAARPVLQEPLAPQRQRLLTPSEPVATEKATEAQPQPVVSAAPEPAHAVEPEHGAERAAPSTGAAPPEPVENQDEASERPPRARPRPRRLELTVLRRWSQPGLCVRAEQASAAQRTLMNHFRSAELGTGARVFLDPRLPAGAEQPALEYLDEAQRILQTELQLSPSVPDLFLYYDVHLLLASACTNADVVAYYDGALHVVVTRDDVRESVLHEFTHHALMTAGILGPAWLQEGMAMHIARETWWRRPELLQQLIERPFGLSTMETMVPYTLESEDAVLFYAQSAAMVECATREPDSTLGGLLSELNVQQSGEALEYGLPAPAELSALRECLRELLQDPRQQ